MHDIIIIGGGAVGAATAYYLSKYNLNVLLLEGGGDLCTGASKANSAIVHGGYDPKPNTLMAKLNLRGNRLIEELSAKLSFPYKKIGSLVLAFNEEERKSIDELYNRGTQNGISGLSILDKEQILEIEPLVSDKVISALHCEEAGVVSPWGMVYAFGDNAVSNGVSIKLDSKVTAIKKENGIFSVICDKTEYKAKYVVNAAGVHSGEVAKLAGDNSINITAYAGQYHLLDKGALFPSKVIFRAPTAAGKGILIAPTAGGNTLAGPTSEKVDYDNTATDTNTLSFIEDKARELVPSIDFRQTIRTFSGLRAKADADDFIIAFSKKCDNLLNLAGIKSPGLTAAPAIGEMAAQMLCEKIGNVLEKESYNVYKPKPLFRTLSPDDKKSLAAADFSYAQIICRCETVTKGDIEAALLRPLKVSTLEGVKRRCNAGMGRCQSGFCSPKVVEIIAHTMGISPLDVRLESEQSYILTEDRRGI